MLATAVERPIPVEVARPDASALEAILDNPHLPTPPALALQIVDMTSRPDCEPKAIIRLLSQDPGLCGKVLQAANSSSFGLSRPVASLDRAVMVMGLKSLRSLVLGWSLSSLNQNDRDPEVWRFWRESVAGAVIVRELAVLLRRPDPQDDLVTGLLRDLGVLVLRQVFKEEYKEVAVRNLSGEEQCRAEEAAFGVDHCEVSAGLLNDWRLPPAVVEPIRFHHYPERCTATSKDIVDRAWLLNFASDLARLDGRLPLDALVQKARTRFNLNPAALVKFLSEVSPRIEEFAKLLRVDIGRSSDLTSVIAAGCRELIKLSTSASTHGTLAASMLSATVVPLAAAPLLATVDTRDMKEPKTVAPTRAAPSAPEFDVACLTQLPPGGVQLRGYQIRHIIGRGAMGVVFKAYDPDLDRHVAIKMLTPERVVFSEARERFTREARAVAAIQHENVVTIHAIGEASCLPYLVMEYVDGVSLGELIDQPDLPSLTDIIHYGRQTAAGLQAAHARGIVHRDIKPANILVDRRDRRLKITDFGLARLRDTASCTQAGLWVGTPLFMSPEQFQGGPIDHRADLFALGSVLYTLCAGQTPFQAEAIMALMREVCEEEPAPLQQLRPEVPNWLAELIAALHAKDPKARPATAAEVVKTFDRHDS